MRGNLLRAAAIASIAWGCVPHGNPKPTTPAASAATTTKPIMQQKDFTTAITVHAPPEKALAAIQDFRGWWSEEIQGPTDQLNATFFYHYKDVHLCHLQLVEQVPGKRVVYRVTDNRFNFTSDTSEWVGTRLVFDLEPQAGGTRIRFTHEGLVPSYECYAVCQDAWTSYIQGSLKSYIETGTGKPNGKEGGLNAELVAKWGLPDK